MPNTQIYNVYLIKKPDRSDAIFQFSFRQDPLQRPIVGVVITNRVTLQNFKIVQDIPNFVAFIRITHDGETRLTSTGAVRVTGPLSTAAEVSHDYYVTPANNPNRISSYTTAGFANDQTLKQLFR